MLWWVCVVGAVALLGYYVGYRMLWKRWERRRKWAEGRAGSSRGNAAQGHYGRGGGQAGQTGTGPDWGGGRLGSGPGSSGSSPGAGTAGPSGSGRLSVREQLQLRASAREMQARRTPLVSADANANANANAGNRRNSTGQLAGGGGSGAADGYPVAYDRGQY